MQSNVLIMGTSGNDMLSGTAANDTFRGLAGNDTINSSTGSDTFLYASGDGNDWINEESGSTSEIDTLRLLDLYPEDVVLSHVGVDLMVYVIATGARIEVDEHFYSTTANYGIEQLEFAGGTVWDRAAIGANAWYRGTAGNDTLTGSNFDDTNYGGTGDDNIDSRVGSDTFIYYSGDGNDWINEENSSTVYVDTLKLMDLNAPDIKLSIWGWGSAILGAYASA
jgi:hypothetical protein